MHATLVEITNSKRKVISHLMRKKECTRQELRDIFGKSITRQWFHQMIDGLNHEGVLLSRTGKMGEDLVTLDRTKIITRRETDRFKSDLILMAVVMGICLMITFAFVYTVVIIITSAIMFMVGSAFSLFLVTLYITYKVFRTSDVVRYFYKKEARK